MGITERIKELEDLISNTKYNKRTQHAIGQYKAQLARLKEKEFAKASGGGGGDGYSVKKSGDATVVLLGFPSVGKSTLLNKLTNADSEVASYAFTTLDVIPGLMEYKHAKIQILDVPGIVEGAASGKGRGREVLAVLRNADLVLVLIDVTQPKQHQKVLKEIYDSGLRLNKRKPDVKIRKTAKGGLSIGSTVKLTKISKRTMEAILREYRIMNADVVVRSNIDEDEFIDAIQGNKKYVPGIIAITKADIVTPEDLKQVASNINPDIIVSAHTGMNVEELKEKIFDSLGFIRIFCKEVGKKADMEVPLIIQKPVTISDMCVKLHKDFLQNFKFAKVWGSSAKFDGQMFHKPGHHLKDKDIVELHIK